MVKFITESSLRDEYRKEQFKEYKVNKDEKLTPGGRQYLSDKGIKIISVDEENVEEKITRDSTLEKMYYTLKGIEISILKEGARLEKKDIVQMRELVELSKDIFKLSDYIKNDKKVIEIEYKLCSKINEKNIREDIEECIDIVDIIMNLKERDVLLCLYETLYKLKTLYYRINPSESEKMKVISKNINIITNKLNIMICKTIGGLKCQRTIDVSSIVIN